MSEDKKAADKAEAKKLDKTPVTVVAVERGHDGNVVIEAGQRFSVPKHRLDDGSTWFVAEEAAPEVVEKTKPTSKTPPGAGPVAGSKIAD